MSGNFCDLPFDPSEPPPGGRSFDPIPAGWYPVMIVGSEMKPTKAGTGRYLQLELDIIDGEFEGRKLFDRLNLDNPNQQAVDIARRTLSQILAAVGIMSPKDSSELHYIPLRAKVKIKPASGEYEASNEIKAYGSINGGEGAQAPKPAAADGGKKVPAWKR